MSSSKIVSGCSEDDSELRRGPWTLEEDNMLTQYITNHGEGRWNLLAKRSGLKRTGKSCRLRWLNYLKPDVKRGNLAPQEQLLILELHSIWGNRWSKIAQHLPGRTDNEIKNYWRTRIQKPGRHLKIDRGSTEFQELVRRFWIPRLIQKVKESSSSLSSSSSSSSAMSIQNHANIIPMPNHESVSQYYSYSDVGKIIPAPAPWREPCVQQQQQEEEAGPNYEYNSDSEHNNGSCISLSETVYGPKVPQLLGYTTNEFNGLVANNDFGSFSYDGYHVNNNAYDIDTINMAAATATTTTRAAEDMEYPTGDCQMAESIRVNNDFACGMWNIMDELWQFSNMQK